MSKSLFDDRDAIESQLTAAGLRESAVAVAMWIFSAGRRRGSLSAVCCSNAAAARELGLSRSWFRECRADLVRLGLVRTIPTTAGVVMVANWSALQTIETPADPVAAVLAETLEGVPVEVPVGVPVEVPVGVPVEVPVGVPEPLPVGVPVAAPTLDRREGLKEGKKNLLSVFPAECLSPSLADRQLYRTLGRWRRDHAPDIDPERLVAAVLATRAARRRESLSKPFAYFRRCFDSPEPDWLSEAKLWLRAND